MMIRQAASNRSPAQLERGTVMLELAVVIPVLLTLGLGVLEFSNMFYKYHLMENAVRDAARFGASRVGSVCSDAALQNEIIAIAKRTGADSKLWVTGSKVEVACSSYDNKAAGFKYRGGNTINTISVTATVPYNSLGFLGFLRLAPPTLVAKQEERVIGVR
jgi:Flp pilus assembly protein TadG